MQLSSKMTFSAKKLKQVKICLLHCKKQHLATFSDWERSFWAFVASHSHNLLSCTKHRIGVLRSSKEVLFVQLSSKMTFSAKKLKHVKMCLLHCKKTVHFIRKKHFMYLSFALKIAFSYFFWLRKKLLSICGLAFS